MPAATVIPVLHYQDVQTAAAWLCRTFGFSERLRIGTHRVQLNVGEGAIVIAQSPQAVSNSETAGHAVMVRVSNVDRHFAGTRKAGATVIHGPTSHPYGERQYSAVDPGGHVWTFSQTEANVDPSLWGGELVRGLTND